MPFKTKLDFSNNRQVKQHIETLTALSGASSFGVPFSYLPTGPNTNVTAITETYNLVSSSFSGNNSATTFTWYDSRMALGEPYITPITPATSGATPFIGPVYTASSSTTIDGNLVNLSYSGVMYDFVVVTFADLGGSNYSGTLLTNTFNVLTADTIDFTGRTIWVDVSGITRTQNLIISDNPIIGNVWTCINSEGKGGWIPSSGGSSASTITVWTAGTGSNTAVLSGSGSFASGNYSVAEGSGTTASGQGAHAEGGASTASGAASHAEGFQTKAIGLASHSEGSNSTAIGITSHSEGTQTTASNNNAHAEGYLTTASGNEAHAQNKLTIATGDSSHAEGSGTTSTGNASHSEGLFTWASGDFTHAAGESSIANGKTSFVFGKNNVVNGDYSSILGGSGNTVNSGVSMTVIVGGSGITATQSNMTYVPDLVIDGLINTDPLATDANGKIVAGVSDARLKTNIKTLTNAFNKIKNLRGVSFEFTEESNMGGGTRYGFIAQEVKEIIPDIIRLRPKGDGMLSMNYTEIVPLLVEAIKELTEGVITSNIVHLETQTILAEDNNIDLNYGGNKITAVGGGITVLHAKDENTSSQLITDANGDWITNNDFKPNTLTLPYYTPISSSDKNGNEGNITRDDNYIYIKTKNGWKRSNLESF